MRRPHGSFQALVGGVVMTVASVIAGFAPQAGAHPLEPTTHDDPADRPVFQPDGGVAVAGEHFDSIAAYLSSQSFRDRGGRCAAATPDPALVFAAPGDCTLSSTTVSAEYADGPTFVLPVIFHVIQKADGTGAIAPALLQSQIDVLNEDFNAIVGSRGGSGTVANIRFVLASVDPDGNPTPGYEVVTNDDWFTDDGGVAPSAMKQALGWDPARYLNLYTNDAAGYLGYATFPMTGAGGSDDGVVLLYTAVGRNSPEGGEYNLGRTATHEIGHYLGLMHTFQDGCGSTAAPYSSGDRVADTTAHAAANYTCAQAGSGCGAGTSPIENYMNYANDACMTGFSAEQVNRMRCSIANYRSSLVRSNEAPAAAFLAAVDALTVSFTDQSTDAEMAIASRTWDFGDGETSSEASPAHTYAEAGTYDVELVVKDDVGEEGRSVQTITIGGPGGGGGGADGAGDLVGGCAAGGGVGPSGLALALAALLARRRRR